jgi:hypothetical protein
MEVKEININTKCAILVYPLPEEQDDFNAARTGMTLRCAIGEFYNQSIRRRIKYDNTLSEPTIKLLEEIKKVF